MALRKGMFESYVKERETPVVLTKTSDGSKYSHNRVFDEPESLKKTLANQDISSINHNKKDLEAASLPSSSISKATNSLEQTSSDIRIKSNLIQLGEIAESQSKPNTNATQTKHKVDTNLTQELNTNSIQSKHSAIINGVSQTQSKHKVDTKLNTQKTQSAHKAHTNLTQSAHISTLVGVQRLILLFIFDECKKARSHITEPLSITHIASSLEVPSGSIKTSIARLCEKAFLIINGFKNGRGGWSTYEIPANTYNELLQMETRHKLHTNKTQTTHKLDTKLNTQPNTNASSSSSNLINTTTTELTDDWIFDITPYARFGFMPSHIKQLAPLGVISANEVEQSLIEFCFDFDNNSLPKIKTSKINFLMGLLRSGHSYVSEEYKSEQEQLITEMAKRLKEKQKSFVKAEFITWEAGLTKEEKEALMEKFPLHLVVLYRAHGINNLEVERWLLNYYLSTVACQGIGAEGNSPR
jgi:hypothetical protein